MQVGDKVTENQLANFISLKSINWKDDISSIALSSAQEVRRNKPKVLPLTEDISSMAKYLKEEGRKNLQILKSRSDSDVVDNAWNRLNEIALAKLILFNRRRQGEASKMTLQDYTKIKKPDWQKVVKDSLSDFEMELCRVMFRVEIVGKRERTVPLLIIPTMKTWLDTLISMRETCGVASDNKWLFAAAHYGAMGHIRGSDVLRNLSEKCGAKQPSFLRSTLLRKQIATVTQLVNLTQNELDVVANFMGHDVSVHQKFYRLPEDTLQCAKVAKLLLASEKGASKQMAQKSLDDINIGIDEGNNGNNKEYSNYINTV